MFYVTGPEAECYAGADGVLVSPGADAPADDLGAAYAALKASSGLVVLAGGEDWPECQTEVAIAYGAGVPIIEEAIWHALTD